ncbi:MAG: peptidoglycan DD-metalloendopeptidase family protein [Methylococcales symbiont of Hymedesmia sp. n. MRB-2018]|nr:MAG: peptidoglycan DD-metalloendopeptidase family protein [Methylococcales symbiont of Hymedesmia sp. n. MRB-2018]
MKQCGLQDDKERGWIDKGILLPLLVCLFFIFFGIACTTTNNYASVRNFHKESLKKEKYYEVEQGDTLYSIGFRSGSDYKQLAKWNKISSPYLLEIGQKIKLFKPKQRLRIHIRPYNKIKKVKVKNKILKKTVTISNNKKKVLKFYWQWPLEGKILKRFSQVANKGIDIAGKIGQKVKSAASGKVVYSGSGLTGYGNLLIIKHNYLYLSAYANNSRLLVKEGQAVKKGQVIAEVGRIGRQQASLHFEIRKNGKPVNPLRFLPKI